MNWPNNFVHQLYIIFTCQDPPPHFSSGGHHIAGTSQLRHLKKYKVLPRKKKKKKTPWNLKIILPNLHSWVPAVSFRGLVYPTRRVCIICVWTPPRIPVANEGFRLESPNLNMFHVILVTGILGATRPHLMYNLQLLEATRTHVPKQNTL